MSSSTAALKRRGSTPRICVVTSKFLADGTILELIAKKGNNRHPRLLVWKNGRAKVVKRYIDNASGRIFVPPKLRGTLGAGMQLPSEVRREPTRPELPGAIMRLMRRYVDLDLKYWVSVMLLVLSSWVPERLTSAPYLLVIGPTGSGKTTLLRFLSCLCRRGLLLGNLDTKTLCALPHDYRPTVLMDETVLTPNMCGLLRNGHARGVPVIYRGRPIDLYGPKVISSREPLQDSAFASRCIQIHLVPTRRKLLPLDKTALAMLSHVRSALLRYRFDTIPEPPLRSPHVKGLDTQNFTPRTKEMIRNFAGLFPLFEQFAFSISSALVEQERDFIAQRADDRDAHILRAVFSRCHDYPALTAGQISAVANECARSRGLSLQLSGRAVGPRLRALGLFTDSVGNLGLGIRFSQQNLTTIHELVRAYKLPVQPSDSCPLCRKWVRVVEKQEKKPATRSAERGRRAA